MAVPFPSGGRSRHRSIGLGFALVALGWAALVADLVLADLQLQAGSLVATLALKADIATVAQAAIVSGLGFAIFGGVRDGFGALERFFEAVLQRSNANRPAADPEPPPAAVGDVSPAHAPDRPAPAPLGRNYAVLPDGSVEVDTLLGTRVFASLDEARDFIR